MSMSATESPNTTSNRFALPRGPVRKIMEIALLVVATVIAGQLISDVVEEREERQNAVRAEFVQSWGPEQIIGGPILVVPFATDPDKPRQFLKIAPTKLRVTTQLAPEERKRGLFSATVYKAAVDMEGEFVVPVEPKLKELMGKNGTADWTDGFVLLETSGLAGMTPSDVFAWGGEDVSWQNCREVSRYDDCEGRAVLAVRLRMGAGSPAGMTLPFKARATLRGTSSYSLYFQAKEMDSTITAPWSTPSFSGNRLPSSHTVSSDGFTARWQSVEYSAPQSWSASRIVERTGPQAAVSGVALLEATPIYRMIHRASKYNILFVVLSFTTYFLFELLSGLRIHAVQYGLLGVSLTLFTLLLVSFSEPLGYTAGYVLSAALVLLQASLYTAAISRRPLQTLIFAAILSGLFGFLYVVLSLETYALLVGTVAVFVALSVVMVLTQRVDWSTGSLARAEGA